MSEKPPLFTVTDNRKFTTAGELREGRPAEAAPVQQQVTSAPIPTSAENFATPGTESTTRGPGLHLVDAGGKVDEGAADEQEDNGTQSRHPGTQTASDGGLYEAEMGEAEMGEAEGQEEDDGLGPAPTAAETAEQHEAYRRSSNLIDTMVQQANPTAPPSVAMDFEQLVQSIYLAAVVAMGAGAEPGQKPRIDIIGARQSIDMLAVLGDKTRGNLTEQEQRLLQNALFNLRMMFLEITNALAAQAQRPPAGSPIVAPGGSAQRGPASGGRPGPIKPGPGR